MQRKTNLGLSGGVQVVNIVTQRPKGPGIGSNSYLLFFPNQLFGAYARLKILMDGENLPLLCCLGHWQA